MKCFLSKIVTVWVQVRDLYLFLFRRALILILTLMIILGGAFDIVIGVTT